MVLDVFNAKHVYDCFYVLEITAKVLYFDKLCDNSTIYYKGD
jgi:hypothetical protein